MTRYDVDATTQQLPNSDNCCVPHENTGQLLLDSGCRPKLHHSSHSEQMAHEKDAERHFNRTTLLALIAVSHKTMDRISEATSTQRCLESENITSIRKFGADSVYMKCTFRVGSTKR